MEYKFHLPHFAVLCLSDCLSALTRLTLSTLDMSGHYPGLDWITYRTYQLQFVLEFFTDLFSGVLVERSLLQESTQLF